MKINKPGDVLIRTQLSDINNAWKVGQVLNATTKQGGEAQSRVLIQLGQYTLQAKTPVALKSGENIQLVVKSVPEADPVTGKLDKLPLLSILKINTSAPASASAISPAAIKLRQFLSIQQAFSPLQRLSRELLDRTQASNPLPEKLKNLLTDMQNNLQLIPQKLTAQQLKKIILNSGVFFESRLATQNRSNTELQSDFKYQLLAIKSELGRLNPDINPQQQVSAPLSDQQLKQLELNLMSSSPLPAKALSRLLDMLLPTLNQSALKQLATLLTTDEALPDSLDKIQSLLRVPAQALQQPAGQQLLEHLRFRLMLMDLGQQVDQAIAKITSLQLQPLSRDSDNLMLLLFNLIFRDKDEAFDMNFRIQQQDKQNDPRKNSWRVNINFDFKTLGRVESSIYLQDQQVATRFHTQRVSTADKIRELLPLLHSALQNAGLNVVNLSVDHNLPEHSAGWSSPDNDQTRRLVDEKI